MASPAPCWVQPPPAEQHWWDGAMQQANTASQELCPWWYTAMLIYASFLKAFPGATRTISCRSWCAAQHRQLLTALPAWISGNMAWGIAWNRQERDVTWTWVNQSVQTAKQRKRVIYLFLCWERHGEFCKELAFFGFAKWSSLPSNLEVWAEKSM